MSAPQCRCGLGSVGLWPIFCFKGSWSGFVFNWVDRKRVVRTGHDFDMTIRTQDALTALLQPVVEGMGYEFVGLEYFQQGRRSVLRVYVDLTPGITLDDCERVSHQLSGVLDVESPIKGSYALEISSPGSDRLLFTREHYQRFAGRQVTVRLAVPVDGRRNFKGRLDGVDGDEVIVTDETEQVFRLPFEQIEKARLVPEF